ncbi:MAG: AraC family transcriptional regulator [Lewinellaceae bacterium]|nr:AraC family transcriptional regulator [Lewinellaceae bacterium]
MEFKTYKPARLNNLVISIYERKVPGPARVQFLPDGSVTLIFNIGQKIKSASGEKVDSKVFNPTETFCFLSGLHTKPLYFDMGGLHVVGLILHPAAMRAFFQMPTEEVKDLAIEGDFIQELDYIEDHIRSLSTFRERAFWLENHFYEKLNRVEDLPLAMKLNRTVEKMKQDTLQGKRLDIEAYSGYSKMHTHRIFKDWLGLTPGKLMRLEQFLHSIDLIHQTGLSLTQIGFECGFYDQAHFIRTFDEFARMTPGQYKSRSTGLPRVLPW